MITLYTWSTPNGRKVSIALEELGFPVPERTRVTTLAELIDALHVLGAKRADLPYMIDGAVITQNPKLARMVDPGKTAAAYRSIKQHLSEIDPRERGD